MDIVVLGSIWARTLEQHLDHADVGLLLRQMRGEAVPQRVQRDGLVDLGHPRRGMAGPVELVRRERVDRVLPRRSATATPGWLITGPSARSSPGSTGTTSATSPISNRCTSPPISRRCRRRPPSRPSTSTSPRSACCSTG
jgi:hypothetical protein